LRAAGHTVKEKRPFEVAAMVTLTIDGRAVRVTPGTTVLDAALAAGIDIPRLCHHADLSFWGECRLCFVEVEGQGDPVPSCSLRATQGMVVTTRSDRLRAQRRQVLAIQLANYPMRCDTCEREGACDLQRYATDLGLVASGFKPQPARTLLQDENPFFVRDHQYCIACMRCVRVCDEIVGANAIASARRGFRTYIATPGDAPLADGPCTFCGNCVQVCPTIALWPVSRRDRMHDRELTRTRTVCPYCGTGCGIEVATRNGEIVSVSGYPGSAVNGEFLCAKGRFGLGFVHHPHRLRRPLVRRDLAHALGMRQDLPPSDLAASPLGRPPGPSDSHVEVDWETALDLVASRLSTVVQEAGPDAVGGIGSAQAPNEDNYIFQKLMRGVIGTNNVDLCARL
jgi:predicted molibdopterin-dependent oxidoreductase YjgC